jgi:hypothetical protein
MFCTHACAHVNQPDTKVTPVKQQQKFAQNVVPCEYLFTVDETCECMLILRL